LVLTDAYYRGWLRCGRQTVPIYATTLLFEASSSRPEFTMWICLSSFVVRAWRCDCGARTGCLVIVVGGEVHFFATAEPILKMRVRDSRERSFQFGRSVRRLTGSVEEDQENASDRGGAGGP